MNNITELVAPVSNVNDTSVVIFELLVENNSYVKADQEVISIETSKATQNLVAPCDGYIKFIVAVEDEVPNGSTLAVIADSIEGLDEYKNGKITDADETRVKDADISSKSNNMLNTPQKLKKKITFGVYDHAVTLGEIMVKNGAEVDAGKCLCKVRDGDKLISVQASDGGYVFWYKKPYDTIIAGEPIGVISDSKDSILYSDTGDKEEKSKYDSLRISKAAKKLLDDMGINVKNIGLTGLVTANDILNRVGPNKEVINNNAEEKEKPATSRMEVAHSSNGRYVKLSKSKRSEANFLYSANRDAVVSQASVMVPTQGIISACADNPELAEKFSAIIILETSRLLKNYTSMTSVYDNGQIFEYDSINVGYALSIDDGLKVPVFKNSDQKSLESLISEKEKFIEKYISRELSIEDLSGGTFTITDLSSTGCYLFNPVLNLGQSVILGVGGENPSHTDYPLILAYDHRVVDGATATEFLCALRERLMSHETVLLGRDKEKTTDVESETIDLENLCCDSCYRSIDELEDLGQYLLKTIDKTGHEKHICSICMGGW